MAIYRQVHITFWTDPCLLEWSPEEKYFYLYLMTNPYTNQIGIYEISKKMISMQLGYSIDTVSILIKTMIDRQKILYSEDTNEVYLLNWIKYNKSSSPKVLSLVDKELAIVKNQRFAKLYHDTCTSLGLKLKPLSIQYPYSMDTHPQKEQEQEQEEEEEQEQQQEKEVSVVVVDNLHADNIFSQFEKAGFGLASSFQAEKLSELEKHYGYEWTSDAIKKAALSNAFNLNYVEGILKNWKANGRNAKKPIYDKKGKEIKKDFKEREYDYDELERKLLGWDKKTDKVDGG